MTPIESSQSLSDTSSNISRRDFVVGASLAAAGSVLIPGDVARPKELEMTDEEYVAFHTEGLLDVYNLRVNFKGDYDWLEKRTLFESLLPQIALYPPTLLNNALNSVSSEAGYISLPEEKSLQEPYNISFYTKDRFQEEYPMRDSLADKYGGFHSVERREIGFCKSYGIDKILPHELGHLLHSRLGNVVLTGYEKDVYSPGLEMDQEDFFTVLKEKSLLYPGFVRPYSLYTDLENAATSLESLMTKPLSVFQEISSPDSELVLKYLAWADLLYLFSGGLMDAQYFNDLAKGNVNLQYWLKKEPTQICKVVEDEERKERYYFVNLGDGENIDTAYVNIELGVEEDSMSSEGFKKGAFSLAGRDLVLETQDFGENAEEISVDYVLDGVPRHLMKVPLGFSNRMVVTIATVDTLQVLEVYAEIDSEQNDDVELFTKIIKTIDTKDSPQLKKKLSVLESPVVQLSGGVSLAIAGTLGLMGRDIERSVHEKITGGVNYTEKAMTRRQFLKQGSIAALGIGLAATVKSGSAIIGNVTKSTEFEKYDELKKKFWSE